MDGVIATAGFHDVQGMIDMLVDTINDLNRATDADQVVYLEDANGNPLNFAKLHESTLTDGSKVYKLVLSGVKESWCGHGQYDSGTCAECKSVGWMPKR